MTNSEFSCEKMQKNKKMDKKIVSIRPLSKANYTQFEVVDKHPNAPGNQQNYKRTVLYYCSLDCLPASASSKLIALFHQD